MFDRKQVGFDLRRVAGLCQALANETHPAMLRELFQGTKMTAELIQAVGLDRGQLYHHLRDLFIERLVEQPQRGRYALTGKGLVIFLVAGVLPQFDGNVVVISGAALGPGRSLEVGSQPPLDTDRGELRAGPRASACPGGACGRSWSLQSVSRRRPGSGVPDPDEQHGPGVPVGVQRVTPAQVRWHFPDEWGERAMESTTVQHVTPAQVRRHAARDLLVDGVRTGAAGLEAYLQGVDRCPPRHLSPAAPP